MTGKELHDAIEALQVQANIRPAPRNWEDRPAGVQRAFEGVARLRSIALQKPQRTRRGVPRSSLARSGGAR